MSFDSREYRDALGRFATGVCVITADPEGYQPFGMTVNSFASVSLEPPLLLWSLQKNSEMLDAFDKTRYFAVNVLAKEQQALSDQYAKKGDHVLDAGHFRIGASSCPVLRDVLVSFECVVEARHDGGDHIIIVGRVMEMQERPNGEPLLFYRGGYRELH